MLDYSVFHRNLPQPDHNAIIQVQLIVRWNQQEKSSLNFHVLSAQHSESCVLQPNHYTHVLIWASQTPEYTAPTPQHTQFLFESQAPDCSSLIWFAS